VDPAVVVSFAEDDGALRRWAAVAELSARHPGRVARAVARAGVGEVWTAAPAARRVLRAGVRELDGPAGSAVRLLSGV
jgi:hypothetical protein